MTTYSATTLQVPDTNGYLLTFIIDNMDNKANKSLSMLSDILSRDWGQFVNFSLPVITRHKDNKYTQLELSFYQEDVSFSIKEKGEVVAVATTCKSEFFLALDKALRIAD